MGEETVAPYAAVLAADENIDTLGTDINPPRIQLKPADLARGGFDVGDMVTANRRSLEVGAHVPAADDLKGGGV